MSAAASVMGACTTVSTSAALVIPCVTSRTCTHWKRSSAHSVVAGRPASSAASYVDSGQTPAKRRFTASVPNARWKVAPTSSVVALLMLYGSSGVTGSSSVSGSDRRTGDLPLTRQ